MRHSVDSFVILICILLAPYKHQLMQNDAKQMQIGRAALSAESNGEPTQENVSKFEQTRAFRRFVFS